MALFREILASSQERHGRIVERGGVGVRVSEEEKGTDDQYHTFRDFFSFNLSHKGLHPCIKKQEQT